jgi:hypothetical protein
MSKAIAEKFKANSISLQARIDTILAQRLGYALRHPHSQDAVLVGIETAQALLARVGPAGGELEESGDHDA